MDNARDSARDGREGLGRKVPLGEDDPQARVLHPHLDRDRPGDRHVVAKEAGPEITDAEADRMKKENGTEEPRPGRADGGGVLADDARTDKRYRDHAHQRRDRENAADDPRQPAIHRHPRHDREDDHLERGEKQPEGIDLDEPAGFIDRVIGGDVSGIDFDSAIAEFEKSDPPEGGSAGLDQ
jgi:hypothetical protein